MAAIASQEYWKKNHLARNAELGVMSKNALDVFLPLVRNRGQRAERR
jgi:hypothetical protein